MQTSPVVYTQLDLFGDAAAETAAFPVNCGADWERRHLGGGSGECVSSRAAAVGRGVLDPPQMSILTYDADGNMTGDGIYAYSYDAENRLKSTTESLT